MSHLLAVDRPSPVNSPPALPLVLETELAPLVSQIDEGLYPVAAMRRMGQAGAFKRHLALSGGRRSRRRDRGHGRRRRRVHVDGVLHLVPGRLRLVSGEHRQRDVAGPLQPGIADGSLLGGTGLSNPIKALSGIEGFALRATRAEGGYVVTGVLPWVSNLGDGHLVRYDLRRRRPTPRTG